MRNVLLLLLFIGVFAFTKVSFCTNGFSGFGVGLRGTGPVATEVRSASGFHAIDMDVAGDVEISIGDQYAVTVSAQSNLLPVIKTEVVDGTLRIFTERSIHSAEGILIKVTAPSFDDLALGGSGTIRSQTPLQAARMELSIGGSGDIYLNSATLQKVDCHISGSGNIHLSGTADELTSDISGSGGIAAKDMSVNHLRASISGSGDVAAQVMQSLNANISGSGTVRYSGQPVVESSVSGSGSVERM